MSRAIVTVATGAHYIRGQERLTEWCAANGEDYVNWRDRLPPGSPDHSHVPYAFKAFALQNAVEQGFTTLLWADSCIIPVKPLLQLWKRIEREGYWIGYGGWTNYEWTADSAYADLFPDPWNITWSLARTVNREIPHVVATSFGLSVKHPTGRAILDEYLRLAKTRAFCGPWINSNHAQHNATPNDRLPRVGPCGPADVRGHRHDQTALSVIAWKQACKLTSSPEVFAYGKLGDEIDSRTILLADGLY